MTQYDQYLIANASLTSLYYFHAGRYLIVGLLFISGTAPEAGLAVLLCRTAACLSLLHLIFQLLDMPKLVNIIEKTGAVLIGYMAVMVLIKTKQHFVELDKIEELTGLDL